MGAFFTAGGTGSYFFHIMPSPLRRGCNDSWGSFGLFQVDENYQVVGHFAQYFASQLLTREWVQPVDEPHQIFRVESDVKDSFGNRLVTAYAVQRPDSQWSLLLVNKDRENAHAVQIVFADAETKRNQYFNGQVERVTFGATEYQWHDNGGNGRAEPDGPSSMSMVTGSQQTRYSLPKASITVLRGKIGGQ